VFACVLPSTYQQDISPSEFLKKSHLAKKLASWAIGSATEVLVILAWVVVTRKRTNRDALYCFFLFQSILFQSIYRAIKSSDRTDLNSFGDLGDGFAREEPESRRRWRKSNFTASDVHHCQSPYQTVRLHRWDGHYELENDDSLQPHPVNNKCECTIDQEQSTRRCCIDAGKTLRVDSPGGSTFLRKMTSWPPSRNCGVISKIRLSQSMHIYVKNNPVKFHSDLFWNDGALWLFKTRSSQQEQDE